MQLNNLKKTLAIYSRVALTCIFVVIASFLAWRLWWHYEMDPWTRDGRIKANVIQVAPDVSGQVTKVLVHDNQQVNIGDVLFDVDTARFELALRQAEAAELSQRIALEQAIKEARRNNALRELVSDESKEQGSAHVEQLRAALTQATINRDLAKLNLKRTHVLSPVNGRVANLDLRTGSYVSASHAVLALIDTDSYYVEGYFEETKLPRIAAGDAVTIIPMGSTTKLPGHVDSIASGIAERDRLTSPNLLTSINPTFNWVRLAQRIPVRITFDKLPQGTTLVAGQTVTVDVRNSRT
ncbi:HlyD family secretion protein [Undibacterium sp. 14-3-2]|uniref:efflux RND transporter periplasmic adaptor subunit n=1 Tax=Undibacterium sp. 14-3-2 TaxID=2800129 RepID=UPI0019035037|nr:HlyD family secretion protein [Undibacterium sp. 14-3-2]MBK1891482.1 HlyD family secretion protein [Undibacterium sp. 14-3-2]